MSKSFFGSKTKSKNSFAPWSEALPYLLGDEEKGIPGVMPDSARLYQEGGFTPEMGNVLDNYLNTLQGRQGTSPLQNRANEIAGYLLNTGQGINEGQYDTNFAPVDPVNMRVARESLGALDPTKSMQQLLSGRPDNPYLDSVSNAITRKLTRNTMEQVMPGIRSDAILSGQYGGSRQGIAEGLAASRLNEDLAPALTGLYGSAYESAQNRMAGAADSLNNQAFNLGFGNANLGLQNNQQQIGQNQTNLNNRMQGLNFLNSTIDAMSSGNQIQAQNNAMQDDTFSRAMAALGIPQDMDWTNLGRYQSVAFPGAQLGGTSKGTQTQQPGIVPSILGAGLGIAGIASGLGGMGGGLGSLFSRGASSASPGMMNMMSGGQPMFSGASSYPMLRF